MFHELLQISDEVLDALNTDKAIVALESTIISHGMPYPQNMQTAQEVEEIIRAEGATPATIALYQGKIHIGLSPEIMRHIAKADDVAKASRRDIAFLLSAKKQPAPLLLQPCFAPI